MQERRPHHPGDDRRRSRTYIQHRLRTIQRYEHPHKSRQSKSSERKGQTCQFSPANFANACSSDRSRVRTRSSSAMHRSFSRWVPWRMRSRFLYSFSRERIVSRGGREASWVWRVTIVDWSWGVAGERERGRGLGDSPCRFLCPCRGVVCGGCLRWRGGRRFRGGC